MINFRRRRQDINTGHNDVPLNEHNEYAGAKKVLKVDGLLHRIGAITTPYVSKRAGETIALYNNSATVAWFIAGRLFDDVAATPDATNAIAVPPNSYFYASMGPNRAIKGTAALIAYVVQDNTVVEELYK